jgi:tRNA A37 N6-isopentenylltransferase MiaA
LAPDTFSESGLVKHYLFNIRNPQEAYSTADFIADVDRIEAKESLSQKIITGGTIYYAYHYLLGTSFELQQEKIEVVSARSPEEMRAFLQEKDPEALSIIDANNPARLLKAVQSIETNGKKYSETYFKEMNPKEDFLLIAIVPNDREEYRDYLGEVIKKRMNQDALDEVRQLVSAHGDSVRTWLDILSYEYRFAGKIADLFDADENIDFDSPEVREMIDILLVKERQYTKRQMTFIRKLLSDLSKLPNKD